MKTLSSVLNFDQSKIILMWIMFGSGAKRARPERNTTNIRKFWTGKVSKQMVNAIEIDMKLNPIVKKGLLKHTLFSCQIKGEEKIFNLTTHPPKKLICHKLTTKSVDGKTLFIVKKPIKLTQMQIDNYLPRESLDTPHSASPELYNELSEVFKEWGVEDHNVAYHNKLIVWQKKSDDNDLDD